MSLFKPESRCEEVKFAAGQDVAFSIRNRRNKLIGLWAAGRMGRSGEAAETYAREIVRVGIAAARDQAIVDRLATDIAAAGTAISTDAITTEMERLAGVAALEYGQGNPSFRAA